MSASESKDASRSSDSDEAATSLSLDKALSAHDVDDICRGRDKHCMHGDRYVVSKSPVRVSSLTSVCYAATWPLPEAADLAGLFAPAPGNRVAALLSPCFRAGGLDWCMRLAPVTAALDEWCTYIHRLHTAATCGQLVHFRVACFNKKGKLADLPVSLATKQAHTTLPCRGNPLTARWTTSQLIEALAANDGTLVTGLEIAYTPSNLVYNQSATRNLTLLRAAGFPAPDVQLDCKDGGALLPAHRAILAAHSDVFAAMFRSRPAGLQLADAAEAVVPVQTDNPVAFRAMVQFMQTCQLPETCCDGEDPDHMLLAVLRQSDRFQVPLLTAFVREQLDCFASMHACLACFVTAVQLPSLADWGSTLLDRLQANKARIPWADPALRALLESCPDAWHCLLKKFTNQPVDIKAVHAQQQQSPTSHKRKQPASSSSSSSSSSMCLDAAEDGDSGSSASPTKRARCGEA